jgi:hypothetical protein
MTRFSLVVVAITLLTGPAAGQKFVGPEEGKLPVKRVVLYKNGVGYFEHVGRVRDNQDVSIPFTSGQLNDVLKSLTVLDLSGGRITGVGYGSSSPVDKQMAELRLAAGEKAGLTEFLGALRGARIEVRSGTGVIAGRLLSVERKTRMGGGATLEVDYLSLMTDSGELRTTELSPQFSVRLLERSLSSKVNSYLDLASASREADVRRMIVSTAGSGERDLFLSYISEVPVWKATYRVVLGSKPERKALLQGWAIVDNTVGQDWENVELSLVAGAPQSFIQNLSQPFYTRRPTVALAASLNPTPQTYEATLVAGARLSGTVTDSSGTILAGAHVKAYDPAGALAGSAITATNGAYELYPLPEGAIRLEVDMAGFKRTVVPDLYVSSSRPTRQDARLEVGSVTETVTVTAEPAGVDTQTSSSGRGASGGALGSGRSLGLLNQMGLASNNNRFTRPDQNAPRQFMPPLARFESSAVAQELGDLFEYKLKEPITIARNRSALVPIVQSPISLEKVSVWNERSGLRRPLRALWLTNSTGLTLDGGAFSVLEEETFAGEGVFEPIRPGEKRLVSYATDLALTADSRAGSESQRVTRCRIGKGVMIHDSEIREKKTYTFRNEDAAPRMVVVEHPSRGGYELRGEAKPVETTAGWQRFQLPVGPKQTATLVVEEARPVETRYELRALTTDDVTLFVSRKSVSPEIEQALRGILAQQAAVSETQARKDALGSEQQRIFDDQQRLRENIKSLRGSAEEKDLLQRYMQQLNAQETRLEALKTEQEALERRAGEEEEKLDRMIQALSFDARI